MIRGTSLRSVLFDALLILGVLCLIFLGVCTVVGWVAI